MANEVYAAIRTGTYKPQVDPQLANVAAQLPWLSLLPPCAPGPPNGAHSSLKVAQSLASGGRLLDGSTVQSSEALISEGVRLRGRLIAPSSGAQRMSIWRHSFDHGTEEVLVTTH